MAVGSLCRNADKEDVASQVLDDMETNFPDFDYFALVNHPILHLQDLSHVLLVTDNDYKAEHWRGEGQKFDICNHQLFIWR